MEVFPDTHIVLVLTELQPGPLL